jgi:thiosulfate/3-mercaptopyruvate sulfurtransferase
MFWKNRILLFILLGLSACQSPAVESFSGSLIESDELMQFINASASVSLIDVRPLTEFESGHIPGAVNMWRTEMEQLDTSYAGLVISAQNLSRLLGEKGVSNEGFIVLYDDKGGVEAARLWWTLKLYGFENTAILNGGLSAWAGEIEKGQPKIEPSKFVFSGNPHPEITVNYQLFESARKKGQPLIIDSRSDAEFLGTEQKTGAFRAGHIPGAIHFDYSNNLQQTPEGVLKFKDLDDLRAQYSAFAQPNDTIYVYCHSGVRSSHTLFVLKELLGYNNVTNYDGSWVEWSYFNQNTPDTLITQN